jgi:GDPmannose 4,6-dehydratase
LRKVALITGITGQDGSYLAEFLLKLDYEVHGLIRRSSSFNTQRIDHIYQDAHERDARLFLHYGDLIDPIIVNQIIESVSPDEIYNLAAQSHVMVSFAMPAYTSQVDAIGNITILESLRRQKKRIKFYQASTSELFGATPPPQNEESPFRPQSPYGCAKLMAYWNTVNYRDGYGIHATNGILFNHESPRRGETFVTRKICRAVASIANHKEEFVYLGNLEAIRDWGYAKEYVESMWKMLQQDSPSDFVVATGIGASVKQFAQAAFEYAGLNWLDHVKIDERYNRPTEVNALIGDPSKIRKELGWIASTNWKQLAELMVESELEFFDKKI